MKPKISFTSVLKSKSGSRQLGGSSQPQRLIDIYQQYESDPNQDYTLNLNAFRNMAHRSRNSSMNMIKSRNVNEDPENNLESWIQKQKANQNYESFTRGTAQNRFTGILQQNQPIRTRSNLKRNPVQYEEQHNTYNYQANIQGSKGYEIDEMQDSRQYQKHQRKSSMNYRNQPEEQMEQSSKVTPQQVLAQEQLDIKNRFPQLQEQQCEKLEEEFEKLKAEKIAELCMQTKKSVNKEKLQQVISKALENIYDDIQKMAEQLKLQKQQQIERQREMERQKQLERKKEIQRKKETQKRIEIEKKKSVPLQPIKRMSDKDQESEEMLISGSGVGIQGDVNVGQSDERRNAFEEQRRQEQMRNMIKGYISGIQQAKNQGRTSSVFQQLTNSTKNASSSNQQPSAQHSFSNDNYTPTTHHNNTFSNQQNTSFSNTINFKQSNNPKPNQSVGYSFANSNMLCEHSFSRDLASDHFCSTQYNHPTQMNFNKNQVKPPVYVPENQDEEEEQRISLPNVEEVRSDCGDFIRQDLDVEDSEEIQVKRNKMYNVTLDVTGNNIKNIESVHYQPVENDYCQRDNYYERNHNTDLFKTFEENKAKEPNTINSKEKQNFAQQEPIQAHQFVSKTFNSYLSGQMRSEYGQAIKSHSRSSSPINDKPFSSKGSPQGFKITDTPSYPTQTFQTQQAQLNQSLNQSSQQISTESKNIHQLQSKTKLSISSPMNKMEEFMSKEALENKAVVTEFQSNQSNDQGVREKQYAVSSPVGEYKISHSFENQIMQNSGRQFGEIIENKYACAESIATSFQQNYENKPQEQGKTSQNSILSMKPLKISIRNSINPTIEQNQFISQLNQSNSQAYQSNSKFSQNLCHRVAQSRENNDPEIPSSSFANNQSHYNQSSSSFHQSSSMNYHPPTINSGRAFLQSLHEKQSIQIELPEESTKTSGNQNSSYKIQEKASFVAETFRPQQKIETPASNKQNVLHQSNSNVNKISITKITLKSSDRNQVTSPKIISLAANHHKNEVKEFTLNPNTAEGKENVFHKLTIKDSVTQQAPDNKAPSFTITSLRQSIKQPTISTVSRAQNHTDFGSKQNSNTLNQSTSSNSYKLESQKPISLDSMKSSSALSKPPMMPEKKQPLLKLSKNLGNSISQKPMTESINKRSIQGPSMLSSRNNFVKQSFKGVKQSIGNDSDMDFDLELD